MVQVRKIAKSARRVVALAFAFAFAPGAQDSSKKNDTTNLRGNDSSHNGGSRISLFPNNNK